MTEKQNINWQNILADYRVSGESVGSFCKRRKLSTSTLYYWLAKDEKDEEPEDPIKLLPVMSTKPPEPDFVELILSEDRSLRFSPGASPNYVASIVKALA